MAMVLPIVLVACGGGDESVQPQAPATVTVTQTPSASVAPSTTPGTVPSIQLPTVSFPGSSAPTPDPNANVSRPPTTYLQALEHISVAESEHASFEQADHWTTPSGNIYCAIGGGAIPPSCEIGDGAIRDPGACRGAPTPFVGRLEIRGGRPHAVCNTDTIRSTGGAPTIGYGTVVGTDRAICLSEEIGVTCIGTMQPVGFFLRRGEYHLFSAL
jgi:hypothetical protein